MAVEMRYKREIAQCMESKEVFMSIYGDSTVHEKIYEHIITLVHDVVSHKTSMQSAIQVLSVYRVVLRVSNSITTRELYYRTKKIFDTPKQLQCTLDRISRALHMDVSALKIVPSHKGIVYGTFAVAQNESEVSYSAVSLIPHIQEDAAIRTDSDIVLVIEKEAIFDIAVQEIRRIELAVHKRIMLVTGKGYPCRRTLQFLMLMRHVHVLGIFDCDPHGINIYKVYKTGSKNRPHLYVPHMHRVGVCMSDIHSAESLHEISTASKEYALLRNVMSCDIRDMAMKNDIATMIEQKKKASIEDVIVHTGIAQYIINKLKDAMTHLHE